MGLKRKKKWIILPIVTLFIAVVLTIGIQTNVFGKYAPEEPYVEGDSTNASSIRVTYEGSNWKGEEGSAAKPSSTEVPTCEGKKGSETNPFLVLEIVADHAQQQIPYLAAETGSTAPLDVMKIGLQIQQDMEEKGTRKSFVPTYAAHMSDEDLKGLGQWFSKWEYLVYTIGGNGKKENMKYAEIAKLYSLEITSKDLEENNIDPEAFRKQYKTGQFRKYSVDGLIDMKSLIAKYPAMFEKDSEGVDIRKEAKEDNNNWNVTLQEHVVTKEAVSEHYKGKGYIVAVEPGQGDFGFASESDAANWIFTKTGTKADRWKYVEDKEEFEANYDKGNSKELGMGYNWFYVGQDWNNNIGNLYTKYNESEKITGLFLDLGKEKNCDVRYDIEPEEYKDIYTFDYYGVKNNNILKRQLFLFANQKEYDNFHMEVITMTPDELNAMPDTDDTVDMIERADMFYIGDYVSDNSTGKLKTNNIDNVYELYYRYILGEKDYDVSKVKTFRENDLDWDLCYKILYRLCQNANLPLVMTQTLGLMVDEGMADVEMYYNSTYSNIKRRGTLNNLAKLYIIGTQFDLTAKIAEGEYKQTFADNLLDKMETIALAEGAISKESDSPAEHTGYYKRPKVISVPTDENGQMSESDKKRVEKCYYLWNMMTFFPEDETLLNIFYNEAQHNMNEELKDLFVEYGFMRSFFESAGSQTTKLFTGADATTKDGSDGTTGNVAIPHNNGSYVYSTLLGNTESGDFFNSVMNATYLIMNNRPDVVNKQTVKVKKQKREYVKLSDTAVLVDFLSDKNYGSKKSYIKVQIDTNNNGQNGLVTAVTLKNEDGQKAPANGNLCLYEDKACTKECEKVTYGSNTGYKIMNGDLLIAYIPYSLEAWTKDYNQIEVTTIGRIYSIKKKKIIVGKPETTDITINERTLFNLE